jgi:hypothetical protein
MSPPQNQISVVHQSLRPLRLGRLDAIFIMASLADSIADSEPEVDVS